MNYLTISIRKGFGGYTLFFKVSYMCTMYINHTHPLYHIYKYEAFGGGFLYLHQYIV